MAYIANANDPTQPLDTVDRSTAAAEFRTLKAFLNGLSTVASSATPDIFNTSSQLINYTGAVPCTGFVAALVAGERPRILFCGAGAPFTASANLLIDTYSAGQVFTTTANTILMVFAVTTTQFRIIQLAPIVAATAASATTAAALTNGGVLNTPASGNLGNCTGYPGAQVVGAVASATNAVNATNATNATSATNATNATNAVNATNATNATLASTAATVTIGPIALSVGGNGFAAHGLGVTPTTVEAFYVCTTPENNFSSYDQVPIFQHSGTGVLLRVDATNIRWQFAATQPFQSIRPTDGANVNLTPANWQMYIMCKR